MTVETLRKVATYHKTSREKAKRKLYIGEKESPAMAGLLFLLWNYTDIWITKDDHKYCHIVFLGMLKGEEE